jgi:subtilisin family serine protease
MFVRRTLPAILGTVLLGVCIQAGAAPKTEHIQPDFSLYQSIIDRSPAKAVGLKRDGSTGISALPEKQVEGRIKVRISGGFSPEEITSSLSSKLKSKNAGTVRQIKSFKLYTSGKSISKNNLPTLLVLKSDTQSTKFLIDAVKNVPGVEVAEPDYIVSINGSTKATPADPRFNELWGMHNTGQTGGSTDADIDAPEAWDTTTGSSDIVIGIMDTGVDYHHADLSQNIWMNPNEIPGNDVDDDGNNYVDDVNGIDTVNGDTDPLDDNGHGTHVAGTIGAIHNDEGVAGVNSDVKMAICKAFTADGYSYSSSTDQCFSYFNSLKQAGINIVATNNSWGGYGYSQIERDLLEDAQNLGILTIAAASNDSNNNDTNPAYPASHDLEGVISVAATDHNDALASFSNYGASTVDLGAPGVNILSTLPSTGSGGCEQSANSTVLHSRTYSNSKISDYLSLLAFDKSQAPFIPNAAWNWKHTTADSHSASGALDDSKDGNYPNNLYAHAIDKKVLNLSNANGRLCMEFWIKGDNETNFDFLHIHVRQGDGSWISLGGVDVAFSEWTRLSAMLPDSLKTSGIQFGFSRTSDSSVTRAGYLIDDLKIYDNAQVADSIPNYGVYSGTSMATPHVAGAVALAAAAFGNETFSERRNRLLNAVDVVPGLTGYVETSGRLNVANMVAGGATSALPGLVKRITSSKDEQWKTISLADYQFAKTPVVILGAPTFNGSEPVVTRMQARSKTSVKVKVDEWPYLDGKHPTEYIDLLALEPGRYTLSDGSIYEVGTFSLGGTGNLKSINFSNSFPTKPKLFMSIQTNKGSDPVTVRAKSLTTSGFKAALFEQEKDMKSGHSTETVGYVAVYTPTSSTTVDIGNHTYTLISQFTDVKNTWKSVLGKSFMTQEEKSKDTETGHANEKLAFMRLTRTSGSGGPYRFAQDTTTNGVDPISIRMK